MYPQVQTQQPWPQQYPVQQQQQHVQLPTQFSPYPPPPYSQVAAHQPAPYPAGQCYGQCPQQPQVIYRQEQPRRGWRPDLNDPNTCWLISLLTLCCGCLLGEALCDERCCCCLIPCALPRFRR